MKWGWGRAHPLLAGAVAVCGIALLILAGFAFERIWNTRKVATATHTQPRSAPQSVAIYTPFRMDLSNLSPVRGDDSARHEISQLPVPHKPLEMVLVLPIGSEPGVYSIELKDNGNAIWSGVAEARLENGHDTIRIDADFSQVPPGAFDLEVGSSAGIRLTQPVLLEESNSNP